MSKLLVISLVSAAMITGFSSLAQAGHKHHKHHKHHAHHVQEKSCCHNVPKKSPEYACCTTARERFSCCNGEYLAGCNAAKSYVEGATGEHSRAWREGFTDCRFNVYRSCETEACVESREPIECYSSPCCR